MLGLLNQEYGFAFAFIQDFLGSILKFSSRRFLLGFSVVTKDVQISVACDNKGLLSHVTCCLWRTAGTLFLLYIASLSRN